MPGVAYECGCGSGQWAWHPPVSPSWNNLGIDTRTKPLARSEKAGRNNQYFHFLKLCFTMYTVQPPPLYAWPSGQSEAFENSPTWFPMPQNICFGTITMLLACSEAEIEFHSLKCFLTSFNPSTLFVAFRSIWSFWIWSQMVHLTQNIPNTRL